MVPKDFKYTKEHEWVKIEGDTALFGITDHAQSALGDITYVEIPAKGKVVAQAKSYSTVESVKAASDIYAPLSGTIIDVNETLKASPDTINQSPYEKGWICRVRISNPSESAKLLDAAAYEIHLKESK
jgi:glycine cleavage system H protein